MPAVAAVEDPMTVTEPAPLEPSPDPAPALARVATPIPDDGSIPPELLRCVQCNTPGDANGAVTEHEIGSARLPLHYKNFARSVTSRGGRDAIRIGR
jgi:hypothetical protein